VTTPSPYSIQCAAMFRCFEISSSQSSLWAYIAHGSPPFSLLFACHAYCGNPGVTNTTEEIIQVENPGNKDERQMQDTQTCRKYCHNSLRLRLSIKQRLPRREEKEKKNAFKDFLKKYSSENFPTKLPSLQKRKFFPLLHSGHGVLKRRPPRENKHTPVQKTVPRSF